MNPKSDEGGGRLETQDKVAVLSLRQYSVEPERTDLKGEVRRQSAGEFSLTWGRSVICSIQAFS